MTQPNIEDILRIALSKIEGEESHQLQHGDWYTNPHPHDQFEHNEGLKEWMLALQAETAESDEEDLQGWTYLADYTIHPLTPYTTSGTAGPFYIHARINKDNKLEFGVFTSKAKAGNAKPMKCALGRVSEESYQKYIHGDQQAPILRIAGKEESEKMLLKGGKLIKSACPKFVGSFMSMGGTILKLTIKTTRIKKDEEGNVLEQEEITDAPWFKEIRLYGHLWTYWASIIDNTLYFVGIALYDDNESGTCVYTKKETRITDQTKDPTKITYEYTHKRESVALPPTQDDLKTNFTGNGWILKDYSSTPSCPLYDVVQKYFGVTEDGYFSTRNFNVSSWFNNNCDTSTKTTICSRVIAKIKDGVLTQCHHGDINARLTAWSSLGGVFAGAGSITVANKYEYPSHSPSEENNEENALYRVWRNGKSGYVLNQYPYSRIGTARISAQCFTISHRGYAYSIAALGGTTPPYSCYPANTLINYTPLDATFKDITIVKKDNPEPSIPPDPGAGADVVEEECIEEPPEGLLAEYYDYQLDSASEDYPIKITMTPSMIDLRSYFEVNKCYSKTETDALASGVSYDITLNENSRYLKTPSYSYTVDIEAEGQDGPFEAKKGDESLGQRTIIISGLTSTKADKSITATVSFGTDKSGGSGTSKTTSQTITRASQKEDWRLVGQTVCTPMDKLEVPAGAKHLKITSGGTYIFKIPEKVYLINWVETWVEEVTVTDPETGEESIKKTVHNQTNQRYYYHEQERDNVYDSLVNDGPSDVNHELVGKPSKSNRAGKAYIKVHEKVVSVSLFQMQDTMLWLDTATAEATGSLTITASSGSFTATTSTSSVTQTNP